MTPSGGAMPATATWTNHIEPAVRAGRRRMPGLPELLRLGLLAGAAAYIAVFLATAVLRLGYPYPLETTEPASLGEVQRILAGQPLYAAPTLQYVPLIYGPIYFYVAALVATLTGPDYLPLRLVSLVASVGSLALVFRLVQRETASRMAGLVGCGLLAATNPFAGSVMDIGRVDALFTFLVLGATLVARIGSLRTGPSRLWTLCGAGALTACAAFAKVPEAAAPIALGLLIGLVLTVRGPAVAFVLGLTVVTAVLMVLLSVQTGPWATWFLWNLPSQHALGRELLGRFWFVDALPRYFVALLLGPVFLLGSVVRRDQRTPRFYIPALVSIIGVAWASRAGGGGAPNVLLPALAVFAIGLGLGVHEALSQFAGPSLRARVFRGYVLTICLFQFALLVYDPRVMVPYRLDRLADDELAAAVSALPGPVFAPDFIGYTTAAQGQQPVLGAVDELIGTFGGGMTAEGTRWQADLDTALRQRRFRYVLLKTSECCLKARVLAEGYLEHGPLIPQESNFYAWKAARTPEAQVYVPPSD
jgi:hypothetical protein